MPTFLGIAILHRLLHFRGAEQSSAD